MDELILDTNTPVQITPTAGMVATVQNTMGSDDDMLLVSTHGDIDKKWTKVEPRSSVQFSDPMYLMQNSRSQWIFPVIEHSA